MPLFAIPYPAIDPVLIELGPLAIRWYALSYIFGIFMGWWWARRLVANQQLWGAGGSPFTPALIDDVVLWVAFGIIGGGRLGYVLIYDLSTFAENPLRIFALWTGGMSFHGAFLGVAVALILFARKHSLPLWRLFDVITVTVPAGLFFGRLANFINGELYGRVSDVPWAMVFPDGGPLPRHPSQIYESLLEGAVLFFVLVWLIYGRKRLACGGFMGGAFCAGYGIARTFAEFFREPDIQIGFLAGGLTMGMALSVPMVLFGIGVMIWSVRRTPAPS